MLSTHRDCRGFAFASLFIVVAIGCRQDAVPRAETIDRKAVYEQGEKYFKAGEFQRAVDEFARIIANPPDANSPNIQHRYYVWAFYARGAAYLEMGLPDKAVEDLTAFLKQQAENPFALVKRGQAYRRLGFADIALVDFSDAIRKQSDDANAFLQRSLTYLDLKQSRSALDDATRSIRLKPDNPEAYRVRGVAYIVLKEYGPAIASLERCKSQGGTADDTDVLLSQAYERRSRELTAAGKTADAREMLAKAEQVTPDFVPMPGPDSPPELHAKPPIEDTASRVEAAESHVKAGDDFVSAGDFEAAHDEFTEAIAIEPRADAYEKRAATWLKRGFPDNSLTDIFSALSLGGYTAERYRLKAWALLGVHDNYGSVEIANYLMRQGAIDAEAFGIRGTAYLHRNLFDEAIRDLCYAIEKNSKLASRLTPTLGEAYYRRGKSHEVAGRVIEAQADLERATELGWASEPAATP